MHCHLSRSFWLMVVLGLHLYKERKALFAEQKYSHFSCDYWGIYPSGHFSCLSIKGGLEQCIKLNVMKI